MRVSKLFLSRLTGGILLIGLSRWFRDRTKFHLNACAGKYSPARRHSDASPNGTLRCYDNTLLNDHPLPHTHMAAPDDNYRPHRYT
ncbi:MAG: hypothetical protein QGI09_02175 [Dehalococcoidia bacterium]|nr:hypothetical protein [Dehalococcoidia bacterium]